jgi:hypothetical protein
MSVGWPSDEEICGLAANEEISLPAEAYLIASQYNRISEALAAGPLGSSDLNWCGFAKWSSKAVGSDLKFHGRSSFLRKLGRRYHIPEIAQPLVRFITMALLGGSYSVGLSTANRTIFVEMATFHTNILKGLDKPVIIQVTSPGPGTDLLTDLGQDGVNLLRTAYSLLRQAESASGVLRSELMLGASIALSAYEQGRVQKALEFVAYRAPRALLLVSWRVPYYLLTGRSGDRIAIYMKPHQQMNRFMRAVEGRWARLYSETLSLRTAVNTIMLGKPLIFFPAGRRPPLLRAAATFTAPGVGALVEQYGPPDPAALKGVADWLNYDHRMRFIVAYFMGYQQVAEMFDKPRIRPHRSWLKPSTGDPLAQLQFRSVML